MRLLNKTLIAILMCLPVWVMAASSPVPMLQSVANKMIAELQKNKNQLRSNPQVIHRIVNSVLVPHIDMTRMGASVVGREYWNKATPQQRAQFVNEFKYLVINTYSNALSSYDGDIVKFYPLRGGINSSAVQVKSMIIRKSGQKIPISYNVSNYSGKWKVYDFAIEGVSIVNNYRSQFSGTLNNGGMPALLQALQRFNRGRRS